MDVVIKEMTDRIYAINPQIQKTGEGARLHVEQQGSTHVMIFRSPLSVELNLTEQTLRRLEEEIDEKIFAGDEKVIPGQNIRIRCVGLLDLQRNDQCVSLPNSASNYAICACKYDKVNNRITMYAPSESVAYKAMASAEVRYTIKRQMEIKKEGFLGRKTREEPTGFYEITIGDENADFSDGDIVYCVGTQAEYPIMRSMKGKRILIKCFDKEELRFLPRGKGIVLKKRA